MQVKPLILVLSVLLPATAAAETAPAPKQPPGCTAPQSRQFDFWVGKWDVYRKSDPRKKIANSLIEKLYSGCGIRENWMPLSGGSGGSLNTYVPKTGKWRQFWVDSDGSAVDFIGGWTGRAMVLQGVWPQPGKPNQITRMTYTPRPDGSVEQAGQSSDDGGRNWQASFDLIYRKAAE